MGIGGGDLNPILQPGRPTCILSVLKGVTISGNVRFWAMVRGTPTWPKVATLVPPQSATNQGFAGNTDTVYISWTWTRSALQKLNLKMDQYFKDEKCVFFHKKHHKFTLFLEVIRQNLEPDLDPTKSLFLPGCPLLPPTHLVDPEVGVLGDVGPGADSALLPLQPRLDGLQGPAGLLHGPGVQVQGCRQAEVHQSGGAEVLMCISKELQRC